MCPAGRDAGGSRDVVDDGSGASSVEKLLTIAVLSVVVDVERVAEVCCCCCEPIVVVGHAVVVTGVRGVDAASAPRSA